MVSRCVSLLSILALLVACSSSSKKGGPFEGELNADGGKAQIDGSAPADSTVLLPDSCVPSCSGRECGDDGCGGSCGLCKLPTTCDAVGKCVCVPQCSGKQCGDDGCGGSCGSCPLGDSCDKNGLCVQAAPDSCPALLACARQCGSADLTCIGACIAKGCISAQKAGNDLLTCAQTSCYNECGNGLDSTCESCLTSKCQTEYSVCQTNSC